MSWGGRDGRVSVFIFFVFVFVLFLFCNRADVRALTLSCFHGLISTQTFRRVRTASVDRCVEIWIAPSSQLCQNWLRHVTSSGRVGRKVPECVSGILQRQSKSRCFNEVTEKVTGGWGRQKWYRWVGKTEMVTGGWRKQKW